VNTTILVKQYLPLVYPTALPIKFYAIRNCSHNMTAGGSPRMLKRFQQLKKHYAYMQRSPVFACSGAEQPAGLSLESTRQAALPSFHKQFKPTQPPALPLLPQKPPPALGQQHLWRHSKVRQGLG